MISIPPSCKAMCSDLTLRLPWRYHNGFHIQKLPPQRWEFLNDLLSKMMHKPPAACAYSENRMIIKPFQELLRPILKALLRKRIAALIPVKHQKGISVCLCIRAEKFRKAFHGIRKIPVINVLSWQLLMKNRLEPLRSSGIQE